MLSSVFSGRRDRFAPEQIQEQVQEQNSEAILGLKIARERILEFHPKADPPLAEIQGFFLVDITHETCLCPEWSEGEQTTFKDQTLLFS